MLRLGYRFTAGLGTFLTAVGVSMVMLFNVQTGTPFIITAMVLMGAGMGFSSTSYMLSVQNAVPWNLRGVATASTQFFRTIGGTVGVAVMGTILNAQMAARFSPIFAHFPDAARQLPEGIAPANVLLTPELRAALPAAFLQQLQAALAQSLFWVYLLLVILGVIALVSMYWLPRGRADQLTYKPETSDEAIDEAAPEITMIG